jgi:hypothetical protein
MKMLLGILERQDDQERVVVCLGSIHANDKKGFLPAVALRAAIAFVIRTFCIR